MGSQTFLIDPQEIYFPPTYVSTETGLAFKVYNNSSKIVKYQWRRFSTLDEEHNFLSKIDLNDPEIRPNINKMLLFNSDNFTIDPLNGEIWPSRFVTVFIKFNPNISGKLKTTSYITNIDTGERVALKICGVCLPPHASFSVGTINTGHITLDSIKEYEVKLDNTGRTGLDFMFDEESKHPAFDFSPKKGHIDTGASMPIRIRFTALKVGQFNESFRFFVKGLDSDHPCITVYGRVIGPSWKVEPRFVDFGTVSYGFHYSKVITLTNTSEIPLDYGFNLLKEDSFEIREFNIEPDIGIVDPFQLKQISIEFIPSSVKQYRARLVMSSPKFSETLINIPVVALCECPIVTLDKTFIDVGNIYVNFPYEFSVNIINQSELPAKYEYIDNNNPSEYGIKITPKRDRGVCRDIGSYNFSMTVEGSQLGVHEIKRFIKIYGSSDPPLAFTIKVNCIGPTVQLESNIIDFGNINVLEDHIKTIFIKNNSKIDAVYRIEMENQGNQSFGCQTVSGIIPPGKQDNLVFTARLNDTTQFKSRAQIYIDYLAPINLDIKAKGLGKFIIPSIPLDCIECSEVFAGETIYKRFHMENMGRRSLELKWNLNKHKITPESARFEFSIEPDNNIIDPGERIEYLIKITSKDPCVFELNPTIISTAKRKKQVLYSPKINGRFNKVMLNFEKKDLVFEYFHDTEKEEKISGSVRTSDKICPSETLLQPLVLCNLIYNNSKLPINIDADYVEPFSIIPKGFTIPPESFVEFKVMFDPKFKKDFSTETINGKVIFNTHCNPPTIVLKIQAHLIFPNLQLSTNKINFGSLMISTEKTEIVQISNKGAVPATYSWELISNGDLDVSSIFDIFPTRSVLAPGASDETHVTFFANGSSNGGGISYEASALCHIIGGPEYLIELKGHSAAGSYILEPTKFDFGTRLCTDLLSDVIRLTNKSDSTLDFSSVPPKVSALTELNIDPMRGSLEPGESVCIRISIITGFPNDFHESFFVKIGLFDEKRIDITVNTVFPRLNFGLPRYFDDPSIKNIDLTDSEQLEAVECSIFRDRFVDLSKRGRFVAKIKAKNGSVFNISKKEFSGVYVSHYYVDLGEFMFGQYKQEEFPINVVGSNLISFEIKDDSLKDSGFLISPTSFKDIKPDDNVVVHVSFDSSKRTDGQAGELDYQVPVLMNDEFGYVIHIHAKLIIPKIKISTDVLAFEPTIIGHTREVTIQLQNMNPVSCEINIVDPDPKERDSVFTITPTEAVLGPTSFTNLKVEFSPQMERNYSKTYLINVKYNQEQIRLFVEGIGKQMNLQFNPSEANFNISKPWEDPVSCEVELCNPTDFPIEVYSKQFDYTLVSPQFASHNNESSRPETSIPKTPTGSRNNFKLSKTEIKPSNSVSLKRLTSYAACIIVHGPPKSGKTTVANFISQHLGLRIVDLKELWKDIPSNAKPPEYASRISELLQTEEYSDGFVIDGLDFGSDTSDFETLIVQAMKVKGIMDEIRNDPLYVFPHKEILPEEIAFNHIVTSLTGHFLFMIALNFDESGFNIRDQAISRLQAQEEKRKLDEEINTLFKMTDDEYSKLSEEDQKNVDLMREKHRQRFIEESNPPATNERTSSKASSRQKAKKVAKAKHGVPPDKNHQRLMGFQFTLGSLVKKVIGETYLQADVITYQSVDIDIFCSRSTSKEQQVDETTDNDENKSNSGLDDRESHKSDSKHQNLDNDMHDFEKNEDASSVIKKVNFLLIPATLRREKIQEIIMNNIPTISQLKEMIFSTLIDQPKLVTQDSNPIPTLSELVPQEFYIECDDSVPYYDDSQRQMTPRWIISPHNSTKISVKFMPTCTGLFGGEMSFGLIGCRAGIFKLPLKGICSYPDIDRSPEAIFQKIVSKLTPKVEMSYVTSLNEFHFGSLLVIKSEKTKSSQVPYTASLRLVNTSNFLIEASVHLGGTGNMKNQWSLSNAVGKIQPNGEHMVQVGLSPLQPDTYRNTVIITIKDNPEPIVYDFVAFACVPTIDFSINTLDFDKMLVNKDKTLRLELRNSGRISSYWRIRGESQLGSQFSFNALEGLIPSKGIFTLEVSYSSDKPIQVKKAIQVDILEKTKVRMFSSHTINILAETFDANFDLVYPKGMEQLDFGKLKVNKPCTLHVGIKSKSKYPLKYKVLLTRNNLKSIITVNHVEGVVPPTEKPTTINFTFRSSTSVDFRNAKGIYMKVFDSVSDTEIASVPLVFSAKTVFSSFTVDPSDDISFSPAILGVLSSRTFKITNSGLFPFDFDISLKQDEKESVSSVRKGSPRGTTHPKQKGKKGGIVTSESFAVVPSSGSVSPNGTAEIRIDFNSSRGGLEEAIVTVRIGDSHPQFAGGIPIKLSAEVFKPAIVTNDYELIFPCQKIAVRSDIKRHDANAFLLDEKLFHFQTQICGKSQQIQVQLMNTNPIPCTVDLSMINPEKSSKGQQLQFNVSKKQLEIAPNSSEMVEVTYISKDEGNFSGILDVNVRNGNTMKLRFEGSSTLPYVEFLHHGQKIIDNIRFGAVLINFKKEKTFEIVNRGCIEATVKMNIPRTHEFNIMSNNIINIPIGATISIPVLFQPTKVKQSKLDLKMEVVSNSSLNQDISFIGDGNSEEIILDGFEYNQKGLVFRDTIVGCNQKKTFIMRNLSTDDVRFTWTNTSDFTFSPSVGHLHGMREKEITVNFYTDKAIKHNPFKALCQWNKIQFTNNDNPDWDDEKKVIRYVPRESLSSITNISSTSQDEKSSGRRRQSRNTRKSDLGKQQLTAPTEVEEVSAHAVHEPQKEMVKVVEVIPEPEFTLCNGKCKDIQLKIFAASDFIKYSFDTESIEFPATMMLDSRKFEIVIRNTCQISFDYRWYCVNFRTLSGSYERSHPVPFTVEPSEGSIKSGQKQKFNVIFAPKEVDEFSAKLRCEIPYLSQIDPPEVNVTAFSKRPICHFNAETSDYLTSGRRLPEFNTELPPETRVLEIESDVEKRTMKKFEIVNTTATPYEIKWSLVNDQSNDTIKCETQYGLISSGKKYQVQFSFKPVSNKTVESLWLFQIPAYNVKTAILVVGKVTQN